ncbi:MAG: chromate efflux transporter [Bacteroidota bacterium]
MRERILELIGVFFKLGCIAFGGPAAHIAMMEEEVIEKRKWMSPQRFLDLIGGTNLIPGPNSTEMVMHCGYERAGWPGLFAAGISFIFPATVITGILAYFYTTYGSLPNVQAFIYGIKPAVLAIIGAAILKLGKKGLKNNILIILGIIFLALALVGISEILIMLLGGLLAAVFLYYRNKNTGLLAPILLLQVNNGMVGLSSLKIFLSFLKVGSILYGSGYVLFAYLDAELVAKGLLTRLDLIDAIAAGQLTPGPVLSTATFIGWQLNGWEGAVAATLGIFLPSFVFVGILNPILEKIRSKLFLSYFLDAVNVAAVAVMLAVTIEMARETIVDWRTLVIAILSFIWVFVLKRKNPILLVAGGSLLGYLLSFF